MGPRGALAVAAAAAQKVATLPVLMKLVAEPRGGVHRAARRAQRTLGPWSISPVHYGLC